MNFHLHNFSSVEEGEEIGRERLSPTLDLSQKAKN
jgi:hypothetical protein